MIVGLTVIANVPPMEKGHYVIAQIMHQADV
jgi:hypothetical protein